MKYLSGVALLLFTATIASADLVIEQKIESQMMNGPVVIKIKGDNARMDMPSPAGNTSTIINNKTGDIATLIHQQKMVMKIPLAAMQKQAQAAQGTEAAAMVKPKATGQKEKVGQWDTEIYEFSVSGMQGRAWVAKDFPDAQKIKDQLTAMSSKMTGGTFDPSTMDVPGITVKSEMTTPGGKFTTTMVSATEKTLADSEFVIPADYKQMEMPKLP